MMMISLLFNILLVKKIIVLMNVLHLLINKNKNVFINVLMVILQIKYKKNVINVNIFVKLAKTIILVQLAFKIIIRSEKHVLKIA